MVDYSHVIESKYGAVNREDFSVEFSPSISPAGRDDNDAVVIPDNSQAEFTYKIVKWNLPDPQPTIEELEEWAATQEYKNISLSNKKKVALISLNIWRGNQRVAAGLTVAVLQELVYIGKFLEAQRWLADQESQFGMANEAIAWGLPDVSFAGMVVTQRNNWMAASDQVEATYRSYKNAVEAASTVEVIAALLVQLG